MAVRAAEVYYAKSTGAFPMDKEPSPVFVDLDIDFSKSTGAYPMHDDRNAPEVQAEHLSAKVDPTFATPGPISSGLTEVVEVQRDALGLSSDPSGDSDAGYEARPSTVVVTGADGVDRQHVYDRGYLVDQGEDDSDAQEAVTVDDDSGAAVVVPPTDGEAQTKVVDAESEAKVVVPPKPKTTRGRTRATGK